MILETQAREHACPFDGFNACRGRLCMAWQWLGRGYEETETSNLVETPEGMRPDGDPPRPPGEGWKRYSAPYQRGYENSHKLKLPKATHQRWRRKKEPTKGRCGRIPGGDYYAYADDGDDFEVPF
jgi:hypothetical protein